MPTLTRKLKDKVGPVRKPHRRKSAAWRMLDVGIDFPLDWGVGRAYVPTPETDPESIRGVQQAIVAAAVHVDGLRTVEAISEAVVLPRDVVRRRLAELGVIA